MSSHQFIKALTECEIRTANKNVSLFKKKKKKPRLWQQSPEQLLPHAKYLQSSDLFISILFPQGRFTTLLNVIISIYLLMHLMLPCQLGLFFVQSRINIARSITYMKSDNLTLLAMLKFPVLQLPGCLSFMIIF